MLQVVCKGGNELLVGWRFVASGEIMRPGIVVAILPCDLCCRSDGVFNRLPIEIAEELGNVGVHFLGQTLDIALRISFDGDD